MLAPDYNSGNEVLAMQAAGATIRYCPVDRNLQLDPAEVERHCERHNPDVLYVIHYAGWPQPMPALAELCRRRNMLLVEDCALALLSADGSRPLGTFGDWAVFCLYKTLPLPNGAVLVQNTADATVERALEALALRSPGVRPAVGRTAELMVQRLRSRADRIGSALDSLKRRAGRAATRAQRARPQRRRHRLRDRRCGPGDVVGVDAGAAPVGFRRDPHAAHRELPPRSRTACAAR